jgi:hypothetical protein
MIFAGETEVLGENLPSATSSTTNPTWIDPGANPGLRGERPATNRLSHGTALQQWTEVLNSGSLSFMCTDTDQGTLFSKLSIILHL